MKKELVIVLDFGGQYNQLVARRVRECNVYCEIYSYKTDLEKIKAMDPKGIILTGGPNSCYEADSPTYSKELFELGIPVLGLCYGAQLMMHVLGGKVEKADHREYGKTEVLVDKTSSKIFEGVSEKTICMWSHFDYISQVASGLKLRLIQITVLVHQVKMQKKDYMLFSSIQKYCIHKKVQKCYITSFVVFVDAVVIGEWITLLKNKLKLFVKRLEMEKFYVL